MEYGIKNMEHGKKNMEHGTWNKNVNNWQSKPVINRTHNIENACWIF